MLLWVRPKLSLVKALAFVFGRIISLVNILREGGGSMPALYVLEAILPLFLDLSVVDTNISWS